MTGEQMKATVKVCMFDQYGTVVDMQTGLVEVATPFLRRRAGTGNANSFVTWWRRTHFENSMIDALLRPRAHALSRDRPALRRLVMERAGIRHTMDEVRSWSLTSSGCGRFRRCPRRWIGCARAIGWWCCRTATPTCWRRPSAITASRSTGDLGRGGQRLQAACRDIYQGGGDLRRARWTKCCSSPTMRSTASAPRRPECAQRSSTGAGDRSARRHTSPI